MLEAVSLGLKLTKEDHDRLFALHSGHNNQLRLLHYPPVEAEKLREEVIGRMPAHQDWSSFTFVFQDDVGGLELEDPRKPGSFIAAKPIPGACILNVGDMLQRFSNGMTDSVDIGVSGAMTERSSTCRLYQLLTQPRNLPFGDASSYTARCGVDEQAGCLPPRHESPLLDTIFRSPG